VSKRILPGIRINLFAALLNGTRHDIEIGWINATSKTHEMLTWRSDGLCRSAREVQHFALVRGIETVGLLYNIVFDGLCHNEINVGKRNFDVKGDILAHFAVCREGGEGSHLEIPLEAVGGAGDFCGMGLVLARFFAA
jgi:hypothetical protein